MNSAPSVLRAKSILVNDRMVAKRDGTLVRYDANKVTRAIALAYYDHANAGKTNPMGNDMLACYGLSADDFIEVTDIAGSVSGMLELYYRQGVHPTVEQMQDTVERAIAGAGHYEIARGFAIYRERRAERRLTEYPDSGMSDYVFADKYARFNETLGRREIFVESMQRVRDMHREFFTPKLSKRLAESLGPQYTILTGDRTELIRGRLAGKSLDEIISEVFARAEKKEALPSGRSMQFGGKAILANHSRMFNCSFSNVDRLKFFPEYFHQLLCGCGVGFSVQKQHIALLPVLPVRPNEVDLPVNHYEIQDTIEGWSDALYELIMSYYRGEKIEFIYAKIRPAGSPLKTAGGKAPGHLGLKMALNKVETILDRAAGRALKAIEVYDINCWVAEAVLSGGVRRSATICLFSPDDEEMMSSKTGDWYTKNPQRQNSNNSAVLSRKADNEAIFRRLFAAQKQFGEPGFYFCDNPDAGANPCVEIGLSPTVDFQVSDVEFQKMLSRGYQGDMPGTTRLSGFQHCNLTTINGRLINTDVDFYHACVTATVIGTLQAAYTNMPYLGPVTELINEHDALLGVSICGFMDSPAVLFNPEILTNGAKICRAVNRLIADLIEINPAARITCVKPEGTASLIMGCASGIHGYYSRYYKRRVTANRLSNVYRFFRKHNPQMTEVSKRNPGRDDFVVFPVSAPKRAITRQDVNGVQFLELVRMVQQAWVLAGTAENNRSPGVNHNVSNTCDVDPAEWDKAENFIWLNREFFTGVSFQPMGSDKTWVQPPHEEITTEMDIAHWNMLQPNAVPYRRFRENSDQTELQAAVACAGGTCTLV